ncbi:ZIP zinc transporter domain-containing protein [Phthorimaea operculella]|nr:ZIP zinc transporter domain-containing protein [Phthorimaea operculella]
MELFSRGGVAARRCKRLAAVASQRSPAVWQLRPPPPCRPPSNLALGIGIQNFPEGLAVSLPLQAAGFSVWRAFWYGQLSGMVEPVFGVLGAVAVAAAQPALPYALAFAAGAMIYVVADDIIPEANAS